MSDRRAYSLQDTIVAAELAGALRSADEIAVAIGDTDGKRIREHLRKYGVIIPRRRADEAGLCLLAKQSSIDALTKLAKARKFDDAAHFAGALLDTLCSDRSLLLNVAEGLEGS